MLAVEEAPAHVRRFFIFSGSITAPKWLRSVHFLCAGLCASASLRQNAVSLSAAPASASLTPHAPHATVLFPRVPARVSEALVLRTYPFQEADLVVSFLTRDQGKLRGVAKRARRPKNAFGAGLERLSHVRMAYFQRENRELVNLDSCELIRSQFGLVSDYHAGV